MWTRKWPKTPGYYWFFGWCWKDDTGEFKYHLVEVARVSNGYCYITNGHFMYREEGADGWWQEASLPPAPNYKLVGDCDWVRKE